MKKEVGHSWISVKDSLPDYDVSVLVCNENEPDDMWFSHRSNDPMVITREYEFCNYLPLEITHWQKIKPLNEK